MATSEISFWKFVTNAVVDGTSAGSTLLEEVEDEYTIVDVLFVPRTLASVITPPILSVGQNASNYNNIVGSILASAGVGVDEKKSLVNPLSFADRRLASGSGLYVRVVTPAVAGTYEFDLLVLAAHA